MSDFFHEIDDTISQLNLIIEDKKILDLHKEFASLTENLSRLDYMVGRVPYYIDGMGGLSNYFGYALAVINRGIKYKGNNIPSFIEDHELNQQEKAYLRLLKDYLEIIYNQLLSEETGQLSERITKSRFQKIIDENIFVIGKEDELLEEYIKHSKNYRE
ncbi:hypothetical protein [Paucisalibacillus globulus]|uniref:hypothetical protein n=1 Tax=Paucisalibacillus globulus TaxID=351095 RepID=UPI0012EB8537|nr:hypothetical protein [Paucisalibacillus globulus]